MITSFLSDTKHDGEDLLRCLSNLPKLSPSVFPHGKFGPQYDSCLDEVFIVLESVEESDRIQAYSVLASFLSIENGLSLRLVASSRINTMLDRLCIRCVIKTLRKTRVALLSSTVRDAVKGGPKIAIIILLI